MILFINTSQTDLIQVKLIKDDKVVGQLENREEYKQSELLLLMIDKVFQNSCLPAGTAKFKIQNLAALAVVSGPGAFSALRLGVTTANTLAWSLKIPIIEVTTQEAETDEKLIQTLKNKKSRSEIIIPKYGKEPNITHSTPSGRSGQAKAKK